MIYKRYFVFRFLLGVSVTASVLLVLVQPAHAQEGAGIVTTQSAAPRAATVGQPLIITVGVTNNAVSQGVGIKDFLPSGVSLVSVRPSQGTCDTHHDRAKDRDIVGCAFGEIPTGSSATVEIEVSPTVVGTITNTAVAAAESSPATPANSSSATIEVDPAPVPGG